MNKKKTPQIIDVNYVWYKPYDDVPNARLLARVTPAQARRIVRLVRDFPEYADTCLADMTVSYKETAWWRPKTANTVLEIADIQCYQAKCEECRKKKFRTGDRCLRNVAAGKCRDKMMLKIAAILYPEKYNNGK